MFTNRRISCSLGRTISTGNFESLRVDVEISADIADDVNLEDAQSNLFLQVEDELTMRANELTPKKNKLRRGAVPSEEY